MTTSRFNNHERWHNVEIIRVTRFDENGWCGIITKNHGEIRCKKRNKTKYKLKKGYKGPLTIFFYKGEVPCIADDKNGHIEVENHWTVLHNDLFDESHHGFLYLITDLRNDKRYVGFKTLHTSWKAYTSSSTELNAEIKSAGKDKFKFEILFSCELVGDLKYAEAKMIFHVDAICSDAWYNKWSDAVKWRPALKDMEKKLEIVKSYT